MVYGVSKFIFSCSKCSFTRIESFGCVRVESAQCPKCGAELTVKPYSLLEMVKTYLR